MNNRKSINSILALATLGAYLGLVLVGATPQVNGQTSDPTPVSTPDQNGIYINKRPLRDVTKEAFAQFEGKTVDLNAVFKVTIGGTLGLAKDGKTVILKDPKRLDDPTTSAGDRAMQDLAGHLILAIGDSGWFGYLYNLETKYVTISLEQNDTTSIAKLTAEQKDEKKANSSASAVNMLLMLASAEVDGDATIFIKIAKASSNGKSFIVTLKLPKPQFTEIIQRKLAEEKAAPKQSTQPNGTAVVKPTSNVGMK